MAILKDFKYHSPKTVKEALGLLSRFKKALLLAGGTFVLNHLKKADRVPEDVISLKNIAGLRGIQKAKGVLKIGAMTTIREVMDSKAIQRDFPSLFDACSQLATTPIRNMATIGGNVASRFFWVDLPAVLLSLDAKLVMATAISASGKSVGLDAFLGAKPVKNFVLTHVILPCEERLAFYFRHTNAMAVDVPCLALAFSCIRKKNCLTDVRCVVNLAHSHPVRLKSVEVALEGQDAKIAQSTLKTALEKDLAVFKLDAYRNQCLRTDVEQLMQRLKDSVS
ncbi:MAG: FAD binding domain-containing protein [Candidatus Omnitrophota bacterium]